MMIKPERSSSVKANTKIFDFTQHNMARMSKMMMRDPIKMNKTGKIQINNPFRSNTPAVSTHRIPNKGPSLASSRKLEIVT